MTVAVMLRLLSALILMFGLAACGADGPPVPPSKAAATPGDGIHFSGDARFGLVKGG